MNKVLQILFFAIFVKPLVFVIMGLNIKNRDKLPKNGPAIIIANHNSHLDTLALMSLYPLLFIHKIKPVAAADYFLKNKFLSWFTRSCIGIIPISRSISQKPEEFFRICDAELDKNNILIIFPEGSRGNPEEIGKIKKGVYYLTQNKEYIKIIPVVMRGLGKSLPKGEALFVPFNCDVIIGDEIKSCFDSKEFTNKVSESFENLLSSCITK